MIKQDYKSSRIKRNFPTARLFHHLKLRWGEISAVAGGITLLAIALASGDEDTIPPITADENQASFSEPLTSDEPKFIANGERLELPLKWSDKLVEAPQMLPDNPKPNEELITEKEVTVRSGDTLSAIFKRNGFSARDVYLVTKDPVAEETLRKIRPGQHLLFGTDKNNQLQTLYYTIAVNETLQIKREGEEFVAELKKRPIEIRQAFASGSINDSLFSAGKQAGLSDNLIVKLANIFGWDIDFVLDVRKNDSFALIYQTKYLDGEYIGDGEIVAAQFVNQGNIYRAVRYTDKDGEANYFTPEGNSMRKAFLRAPVNFMYISSNFNPGRLHPVLKKRRAHRGIDYAAPVGTPIYAAGDGKVIASSSNQYNGKYVFIQHGNSIVTKYLHMSRRAVSYGKRVKQGQVIGYVGATGLVSGPHLHYEFVVNGVHRNPRTVKLPEAQPVNSSEKERFQKKSEPLLASLEAYQRLNSLAAAN
ncbi:MAG: peptidoglycan DD-metalloendopeptidase family protein [Gammaproteobacteria bacterium]|nr:peptidoglycan DD-metalloendopeptidase family protein [Gammaproteobacteria bacterium]